MIKNKILQGTSTKNSAEWGISLDVASTKQYIDTTIKKNTIILVRIFFKNPISLLIGDESSDNIVDKSVINFFLK